MSFPVVEHAGDTVVEPFELLDKDGEKLVVLVKATYEQGADGRLVLAPPARQRAVRFADVPWGDPVTTPPRYPCDASGPKPGTDVVVVAEGHAPDGVAVPAFDVGLRIGPLQKSLRVVGPRVWAEGGAGISHPRPTRGEPIRYDLAFGGLDASDPAHVLEEPTNPVGTGITRDRASLVHRRGPSIEDPAYPIVAANAGRPAGFGSIGPHWQPRRSFAGTYDQAWHEEQIPLLPLDHDLRANQVATPDLVATPHLRGDEEVSLLNLTPGGGVLQARLPGARPRIRVTVRGTTQVRHPPLDLVLVDTIDVTAPSRVTVELLWRIVEPVPRRMQDAVLAVDWG